MESTTKRQESETKFCKECGEKIAKKAVICPHCGCQVESTAKESPNVVIQNSNSANISPAMMGIHAKNKWVSLLLCFLLGAVGGHKFYEGKIGAGILYIFTLGFGGLGVLIDFLSSYVSRTLIMCKIWRISCECIATKTAASFMTQNRRQIKAGLQSSGERFFPLYSELYRCY